MVKSKKLFLTLIVIQSMFLSLLQAASVRATVDTIEVVKGKPVTLRIKATGGSAVFPLFKKIGNYTVVSKSTSSSNNWSMVNGSVTSEVSTAKIIRFIPQEDMIIPSYTVNISGRDYKTDTIEIKVVKATAPSTTHNGVFSLTMSANKTKVHVGESFMLTVFFSLRRDVRLSQEVQYTPPNMSEFVVVPAEEQPASIQGNYQVQELRYIVTAEKEGNFSIEPAQTKVGLPDRGRRDIFGMTFGTKWYQTASNSLEIEVLPQIQASDLIGDFSVKTKIDATEVKANTPVNLSIHIEGKGNLESFDFPKYEIAGVTIYSDEATIKTKVQDGALYSTFDKSFVFISEEDFVISERLFTVYNSKEDTLENLIVPAFDVKIKAAKTSSLTSNTSVPRGKVHTDIKQEVLTKEVIVEKEIEVEKVSWWMLVLAFVAGLMSMYIVRFVPKKKPNPFKESEALKILYAHMSGDPEVEAMVRQLYAKKNGDKNISIDKKVLQTLVKRVQG